MKNIKVTWHCPRANQMPSNKEVTNEKRPAFTKRKQMTSYQETYKSHFVNKDFKPLVMFAL